jgi:hypothetical protein
MGFLLTLLRLCQVVTFKLSRASCLVAFFMIISWSGIQLSMSYLGNRGSLLPSGVVCVLCCAVLLCCAAVMCCAVLCCAVLLCRLHGAVRAVLCCFAVPSCCTAREPSQKNVPHRGSRP